MSSQVSLGKSKKGDIVMKSRILAFVVCLFLIISITSCTTTPSQTTSAGTTASTEDFLIGVIQPLTGSFGFGGTECQAALEIAAEEQGTLLGRPIKLVFADAPDDTTATSEVERLMSVQGVKYFIGAYGFSAIPIQAAVMKNGGFEFETVTWETDLLDRKSVV